MRRKSYVVASACVLAAAVTCFMLWKHPHASGEKHYAQGTPGRVSSGSRALPPVGQAPVLEKPAISAPPDADRSGGVIAAQSSVEKLVLEPATFIRGIAAQSDKTARIPLPGGKFAVGEVTFSEQDASGVCLVSGRVTQPYPGQFYFLRQPLPNKAGPLAGYVLFDQRDEAYRVYPSGAAQTPELRKVTADDVVCRYYHEVAMEAPQTHTTTAPKPPEQGTVPVLESLPGAPAVVYLDFDGESGVFPGWNGDQPINAAASDMTAAEITDAWQRISEDYLPFNINITTVRKTFEAAPVTSRMHVIITPTSGWYGSVGGVAKLGSFDNNDAHKACWVFQEDNGKNCAEAASHEVGHTLNLTHDGTYEHDGVAYDNYYGGHGAGSVGWAPIMGTGYSKNLTQWSKGEYTYAMNNPVGPNTYPDANAPGGTRVNEKQDDLQIITGVNNNVTYRADDMGDTYATARFLEILNTETLAATPVNNEGVIETSGDLDAFRFTTNGGDVNLNIKPANAGPNLDILAEIVSQAGVVIASSNPDLDVQASFSNVNLPAGNYFLRISGVGRGNALGDGYTDYGSMGAYQITGSIAGGVHSDYFTIAENSANTNPVGTVVARVAHTGTKAFAITSGNTNGAFSINSANGAITVANNAMLDYEALSTKWDDPATFELNVRVTDSNNSATEDLRVVVIVSDLDEAPTAHAPVSLTLDESTPVGTVVANMAGTDPDRFDYLTYSITSGNVDNAFAIDSKTGVVTTTKNLAGTSSVVLNIQAVDFYAPVNTCTTTLTVATVRTIVIPASVGVILESAMSPPAGGTPVYQWSQMGGASVANLATPNAASCAATFNAGGSYALRLTLGNGSTTVVDDVVVIYNQPAGFTYGGGAAGSVTKLSETSYKLSGASSGIDEGGTSDGFYLYGMTFDGDFDLRTRVVSGTNRSTFEERAGLIVRAGTAGNASEASAFIGFDTTPSEWGHWVVRGSSGLANSAVEFQDAAKALPSWCRLTRAGNTVSAYFSENGINWGSAVGTATITGTVRAGLCWSSDDGTVGDATFDNVSFSVQPNVGPIVNAGPDQTVSSNSTTLAGTLSDDGQPGAAPTGTWVQVSGPGTISFSNSSAGNSTATASLSGIYQLRWIGNDTTVKTFDDVVVTFNFGPYGTWRTNNFGANSSNPSIAGDNADPDKDGRSNLMEYALNSNPSAPDQSGIATDIETIGAQRYLRITVNKNSAATDVTIAAEVSPDLGSTSWVGGGANVTVEADTTTQYKARDNTPISSAARRYIRAKVTRN